MAISFRPRACPTPASPNFPTHRDAVARDVLPSNLDRYRFVADGIHGLAARLGTESVDAGARADVENARPRSQFLFERRHDHVRRGLTSGVEGHAGLDLDEDFVRSRFVVVPGRPHHGAAPNPEEAAVD